MSDVKCEHENEMFDDHDSICADCGEHASQVSCKECGHSFGSECCGARARF